MVARQPLLRFEAICKRFGGTLALDSVSLDVDAGEIVALLGENGAGKSTLIKTLAGIHMADGGRILVRGEAYQHRPSQFGERQTVAFIHQDLGLIEWMTVAENISLAQGFPKGIGLIKWSETEKLAERAIQAMGCNIDPTRRVQELSRIEKSLVAIARALAVDADLLVLDEPTASLPADEVERLFTALRPLRERGVGIIYVSHRLDEIFQIADRVAVLRDGRLVGERPIADTSPRDLVELIVGRPSDEMFHKANTLPSKLVLEVRDFATESAGPVDFDVYDGEVLGLVGLRGAGQESVGRALFGCEAHVGQVRLDGVAPDLSSPRSALNSAIGLVARDRTEESVAPSLSVRENTFLNPASVGRGLLSFTSARTEAQKAQEIGETVGLRPNDPELPVEALSGGNQQKVVVGRWLATDRKLLIAEDPTAGVDVGAKAEIYRLMNQALAGGTALVIISTDFEEVANICHRAIVFSRGKVVESLKGEDLTIAALIHAASAAEAPKKTTADVPSNPASPIDTDAASASI